MKKRMYVASPYGFSEAGKYFLYDRLLPLLERCGYDTIDPWKLTSEKLVLPALSLPQSADKSARFRYINRMMGGNNEKGIIASHGLFAVLDGGQDVDSGVASEIGFASGLGKPIAGYKSDFGRCAGNDGYHVNSQLEHFIYRNGGEIARKLEDVPLMLVRIFGSPIV